MTKPTAARRAGLLDRLIAVFPLASAYLWVVVLLAWQAREQKTPWLFGDEHVYSGIARSIAETGHERLDGQPMVLHTLYPYLIAPIWWLDDVSTAYTATKTLNVLVMAAALFPTYLLARLAVGKLPALFAAVASVTIPAMTYSAYIIQEPFAYTFSTLCLWLIARWLVLRTRWSLGLAVGASLVAPYLRDQLKVLPGVLAVLAVWLWWRSERARSWRARWTPGDWLGAAVLALLGFFVLNRLLGMYSGEWELATVSTMGKQRLVEYGGWAFGAFAIGIGVVPLVLGLTVVFSRTRERLSAGERAVIAVGASSLALFWLYSAVKASYLSQTFATRVVERNLIYAAPVAFVLMALFFSRARVRVAVLAGVASALLFVLLITPNHASSDFQFDAPGLTLLQSFNRNFHWSEDDVRWILVALVLVGIGVALLPRVLSRHAMAGAFAAVAIGTLAWTVAGEITAADGTARQSRPIYANLPKPLSWIDDATGGKPAVFIGQTLDGTDRRAGVYLLSFWNDSVKESWSIDGTFPTFTPDYDGEGYLLDSNHRRIDGRFDYVVTDGDIAVDGEVVDQRRDQSGGGQRVWKVDGPLRLQFAATNLYTDGWITDGRSTYSQFATPGYERVDLVVSPNRGNICPPNLRTNVLVKVGTLVIDEQRQPSLGKVLKSKPGAITTLPDGSCEIEPLRFENLKAPFQVEVTAGPTFTPAEVGANAGDRRPLTIRVGYGIEPVS